MNQAKQKQMKSTGSRICEFMWPMVDDRIEANCGAQMVLIGNSWVDYQKLT